jgi:hypothetical protein
VTVGQPGDKLYAGWIQVTADGQALVQENWGTVIAEVPPPEPGAIKASPARPPHDATQNRGHAEQLQQETGPAAFAGHSQDPPSLPAPFHGTPARPGSPATPASYPRPAEDPHPEMG